MKTLRERKLERVLNNALKIFERYGINDYTIIEISQALNIPESSEEYPDTEAGGYVFCGKCGKMK